ncbi:hypothetical protein ULG90_07290 [Halopseudomonas pachastrellae]|nr:hypothetical protein ULG90_07290 [Halopseudomonas pachastrellae]
MSSLVGDMLINVLEEHSYPFGQVRLVDVDDEAGERRMINGQSARRGVEQLDFAGVKLAIVAGGRDFALQHIAAIRDAGALVIDTTGLLAGQGVTVVAEVKPGNAGRCGAATVVACPDSQVLQSALVLKVLDGMSPVQRVSVATYQSMSTHSKAAVEGLAMETGRLLNGQPIEKGGALAKQSAFNLQPCASDLDESGTSREERRSGRRYWRGARVAVAAGARQLRHGAAVLWHRADDAGHYRRAA